MSSTHFLSITPPEFRELANGRQHALCLPKDEGVFIGDQLVLREFRPADAERSKGAHTGAWLMRQVTAALEGEGISPGHAVYSINSGAENERAVVVMKRQIGLAEKQGVPADRFFRHQTTREKARREVLRKSAAVVVRVRAASAIDGAVTTEPSRSLLRSLPKSARPALGSSSSPTEPSG